MSLLSFIKENQNAETIRALNRSLAIIEFQPDGSIITANQNFLDLMGYDLSDIVTKHHSLFVDSNFRNSEDYAKFWRKLRAGEFCSGEFKRLNHSGGEVWIQGSYNPIFDKAGKITRIVKFAFDITASKNAAIHAKRQLDAIDLSFASIEFDPSGVIVNANKSFLNVMGYTKEEVVGKHHSIFIDSVAKSSVEYRNFWDSLRAGKFQSGEFKRVGKNNRPVWIQGSYNPLFDETGKITGVMKFAMDVTDTVVNREESETGTKELSTVLQFVAEGNLTKKMTGEYSGLFNNIKKSINSTVDHLKLVMLTLRDTTSSLKDVVSEVTESMQDLSKRTEGQASSLEETAASMEEISSTVRQNSDNSQQGSNLALTSQEAAQSGGMIVEEAVNAMQLIESSSERISDIMTVIDEIAFQTNLLALNAAVEAARAGDAGKGFAVVAEEVRNLAQRSAIASKEIKGLILESNEQVTSGVKLVHQAGKSLKGILDSTNNVAVIVKEIAAASVEQSIGLEQINTAISHMDETTQRNATVVENNMAASLKLQQTAEELLRIVNHFEFDEHHHRTHLATEEKAMLTFEEDGHEQKHSADLHEPELIVPIPTSILTSNNEEWAEF